MNFLLNCANHPNLKQQNTLKNGIPISAIQYFSIRLGCQHKIKHMVDICIDADHVTKWHWMIKTSIFRVLKINANFQALSRGFQHWYCHTLIGRSSKNWIVWIVLKNFEPAHSGHGKCSFVPWGVFPCMRTKISDLITCKDLQVILMMIGLKSFHIINQLKRKEDKLKLHWPWNSV